jgi:phosphoserine aminotransferase
MVDEGYLSENHRGAAVVREITRTGEALRALLGIPAEYGILYLGSATEAMERIFAGGIVEQSQHLVQGAFARRFREVAEQQGVRNSWTEVPDGESFRATDLILDERADLLALTQNETSTGARIPPSDVEQMARNARGAGMLVAVDLVTGWPTERVAVEALDAAFFSVQKGFGLPAGLGVLVVSPALVERAVKAEAQGTPPGGYLHLAALARAAAQDQTVATPNTLAIRLLGRVAEDYLARGGQVALARQAEEDWQAWNALVSSHSALAPFVKDPELQSRTVAVATVHPPEAASILRSRLRERGLVVGDGYGPWKGRHLRVAHFPVQTPVHLAQLRAALRDLHPLPPF